MNAQAEWLVTALMAKFDQLPSWDRGYRSALEHDIRGLFAHAAACNAQGEDKAMKSPQPANDQAHE